MKKIQRICSLLLSCVLILSICAAPAGAIVPETAQPFDFNMWERAYNDFTFDTASTAKMERALYSAAISGAGTTLGSLFGSGGAALGAAVSGFISSYVADSVSEYYDEFGDTGYGSIIAGRFGSKMRIAIYLYSDEDRTDLVYYDVYATDHYPM